MSNLFKRVVKVTAWRETVPAKSTAFNPLKKGEALEITDLRCEFKITKTHKKVPNSCDITITNLAAATRTDLETKPLFVQIAAGYDDDPRLLFTGDLRFGMSEQKGPNWETLLQLGDGDCHYRWARVNESYKPGTTVREVLKKTAKAMGFTLPDALDKNPDLDAQFAAGEVASGPARLHLDKLLRPYGYTWAIQNNELRVLRENQIPSLTAHEIDEAHGMIGTPTFGSPPRSGKPPHVNVKMLLYPELLPGDLVKVTTKDIKVNGFFRIEAVKHEGDTHGNNWFTEIEIKSPAETDETASSGAKKDKPTDDNGDPADGSDEQGMDIQQLLNANPELTKEFLENGTTGQAEVGAIKALEFVTNVNVGGQWHLF